MVLASNEWLNNCEDDQMSATTDTAPGNNATTTTTATAATTAAAASTATSTTTPAPTTGAAPGPAAAATTPASGEPLNRVPATTDSTANVTLAGSETPVSPGGGSTASSGSAGLTSESSTTSSSASILSAIELSTHLANQQQLHHATDNANDNDESGGEASTELTEHGYVDPYQGIFDIIRSRNTTHRTPDESIVTANDSLLLSTDLAAAEVAEVNGLLNNDNNNRDDIMSTAAQLLAAEAAASVAASSENSNCPLIYNSNTNTLSSSGRVAAAANKAIVQPQPPPPPPLQQALSSAVSAAQTNFFNSMSMELNAAATMASLHNKSLGALEAQAQAMKAGNNGAGNAAQAIAQLAVAPQQSAGGAGADADGQARIVLICETNSHPFQTRSIALVPNIQYKVGRLIAKSKACESNAIFDCKVLSRNHAVLWYTEDGKFWVKDTKSSNGTFINEQKLGNEAAEMHFGDIVKFGVDVLENSRKEVHGCIIACVKLYMPDGREAISIDSPAARSQYSGEGRISFDELYRLNLYMQEATQREKLLKSKLFSIQNILDTTRKNSVMCWQSLIAEDQLLHRIHSLEKKLQLMDKNLPESALRNEVIKLIDEKNTYQLTAKEALRKVYQERCDALQLLAKMESAYSTSDNECKMLRDQIMLTKQSLQDVNARLVNLESEYNEYREESLRQQQEAKEIEEKRIEELTLKLEEREKHCEELKQKISELLLKRADLLEETEAMKKLDAAIADMDLGDDDDDDDEDEVDEDEELGHKGDAFDTSVKGKRKMRSKLSESGELNGKAGNGKVGGDVNSSSGSSELEKSGSDDHPKEVKEKVAKDSTIMKWLQNSDLNKGEGSVDILKAICNESDSSDEQDMSPEETAPAAEGKDAAKPKKGAGTQPNVNCENFEQKLHSVLLNLRQLESASAEKASSQCAESSEKDDKSNKEKANYLLLKRSVSMLREAYKELRLNSGGVAAKVSDDSVASSTDGGAVLVGKVSATAMAVSPKASGQPKKKHLETQETLKPYAGLEEVAEEEDVDDDDEDEDDDDDDDEEEDDLSDATTTRQFDSSLPRSNMSGNQKQHYEQMMQAYRQQIADMNEKLEQTEGDSRNTLEIMQIECEELRDKMAEMSKLMEKLHGEKQQLESQMLLHGGDDGSVRFAEDLTGETDTDAEIPLTVGGAEGEARPAKEDAVWREDQQQLNDANVQMSEELIAYREQLEQSLLENQALRNEIAANKLTAPAATQMQCMLWRALPYGAAAIAILVYYLTTYQ